MAKNLLTDFDCKNADPREKEYFISDGEGLYLRIRHDGKNWVFRYSMAGKQRKLGLGIYPTMSIKKAREEAEKCRDALTGKLDPALQRKQQEQEQAAALAVLNARKTVAKLLDEFIESLAHADGGHQARQTLKLHVIPTIGKMFIEDVRKSDILNVVKKIQKTGKDRTAQVAFSLIRQMFNYATDAEYIEVNPTAAIKKAKAVGKQAECDRVLQESEISTLIKKLPTSGLNPAFQAAILATLACGNRIGEIIKAEWKHIDLHTGSWFIPKENQKKTKGVTDYTVNLSAFALEQFLKLKELAGASRWVLPSLDENQHIDEKTITKAVRGHQLYDRKPLKKRGDKNGHTLELPFGEWSPHDLRRTCCTGMVSLGVLPVVADKCLNHAVDEGTVRGIYNRHAYASEKKAAWKIWGERLELLTTTHNNVITLKKPA